MESTIKTKLDEIPMFSDKAVRYQGKWYRIHPKKYEPERQTYNIIWNCIKNNTSSKDAYIEWYKHEQEDAKLLYPVFRKNE